MGSLSRSSDIQSKALPTKLRTLGKTNLLRINVKHAGIVLNSYICVVYTPLRSAQSVYLPPFKYVELTQQRSAYFAALQPFQNETFLCFLNRINLSLLLVVMMKKVYKI